MATPTLDPTSPRLEYRRLAPEHSDAWHALIVDTHIRQYLLDGKTMDREWSDAEIRQSQKLFQRTGHGLWLVFEPGGKTPIGFCGFRVFPELGGDEQLLYAFTEAHTGKGYATEAARALIDYARAQGKMTRIVSAVDTPNAASIRVLEKLGFRHTGEAPGAFGTTVMFELTL